MSAAPEPGLGELLSALKTFVGCPPDPFDVCFGCGHTRRCHDSRGCGKWVEAYISGLLREEERLSSDKESLLLFRSPYIVQAHTCPCLGFL